MHVLRVAFGICLLLGPAAQAQLPDSAQTAAPPEPKGISVGALWQGSFIIPHSPAMKHLAQSHPVGAELNVQLQTTGTQAWHMLHKYPTLGFNLNYYNYRHPVLGNSVALGFYINKPMWKGKKQQLNFRMGTGLAWFDRQYNLHENHKNSIISQSINAVMQARLEYEWHFSEPVSLSAGIGLNHYSNGATSKPNLGINLPAATVGLTYYTHRPQHYLKPELPELNKRHYFNISLGAGYKQLNFSDTNKYLALTGSVLYLKPLNHKSNLVAGIEGFYDRSLIALQREDTTLTSGNHPDIKKAAVLIGHELVFGRAIFQTHLGVYVYRPYKVDREYYERLGLKYNITDKLFAGAALKVHRGSADFIEYVVGLSLT